MKRGEKGVFRCEKLQIVLFSIWVIFGVQCTLYCSETPSDLFEEALAISKEFDPETDLELCRTTFKEVMKNCKEALDVQRARLPDANGKLNPQATIKVLNDKLLIDRNVTYISNKYWRDSLFTAALVKSRGNCLSTALLYYLVATELKLPMTIATVPSHVFIRWDDGTTVINIETTAKGLALTDKQIIKHFDLTPEDCAEMGFITTLTPILIRGHLLSNWSHVAESIENKKLAKRLFKQSLECLKSVPLRGLLLEFGRKLSDGKIKDAKSDYEKIISNSKGAYAKTAAVRGYVEALSSQGKFDEALAFLNQKTEGLSKGLRSKVLQQWGVLYRHKREFDKAILCHVAQVEMDPSENSYNELGSVLTEAHRDPDAIVAYEKALDYNSENFFTQIILAGLYERSGDRDKGRAYFSKIEEPRSNKLTWYGALVWYYANIQEEPKMLENMEKALKGDPSGQMYQYFVREPDLDPYRQHEPFKTLMAKHVPATLEKEQKSAIEKKMSDSPQP
jgi:tetratricopeptide (TPR) repeat protein